ncbi:MAG: sulfatase, partial [bacterium]|nr:sulfatase [bacterium]
LYPSKHGAGVAADHLESRFETLPELLRRHGYLTAGFGGGMLTSYRFGVGQGFARFHDPDGFESVAAPLTDRALQFLESQRTSPLFLFVNYFDPHFPYAAPASFQQALGAPALREPIEGLPDWPEALSGSSDAWSRIVSGAVPATAEAVGAVRASYLAEVAFMDQEIGRLLAALQSAELFDRALIVVAADHGEFLGEGGFFDHSARLDPELVEVPLIIKWPHQYEGRRVDAVTSLVDLFPTMLRIAGIRPPEQDGIALAPRMSDAVQRRGRILIEEHAADFHHLAAGMKLGDHTYSLLENGFRQILWEDGSECYRLEPSGWQRRTCPPRWPTSREWLREASMLDGAFQPREGRIGLTDHERESLRALGYIR